MKNELEDLFKRLVDRVEREELIRCWAPLRIPRILEETPEAGSVTDQPERPT